MKKRTSTSIFAVIADLSMPMSCCCAGFRTPATREAPQAQLTAAEKRQGTKSREVLHQPSSGLGYCFSRPDWSADAEYTDERYCDSCLAYFALNGGFPHRITL